MRASREKRVTRGVNQTLSSGPPVPPTIHTQSKPTHKNSIADTGPYNPDNPHNARTDPNIGKIRAARSGRS